MQVQPAHISQILEAEPGRFIEIDADVCGVAADLKQIDPCLKVWLRGLPNRPFFSVVYQREGEPADLVLTQKAYQGATGALMGLDQRIVRRVMEVGSEKYDFAAEVLRQNEEADRAKRERQQAILEDSSERATHALRRLRGDTSRAFIS